MTVNNDLIPEHPPGWKQSEPKLVINGRQIKDFKISPSTGALVALCDDGSLWIHSGSVGAHTEAWKEIAQIPPLKPLVVENEDDFTIRV